MGGLIGAAICTSLSLLIAVPNVAATVPVSCLKKHMAQMGDAIKQVFNGEILKNIVVTH